MTRDPRYDILFEPVRIGPVTARNRFYQVPHCTGIGWTQPETLARLRGIKAEGGWAVVATEETEIHPSADCEPFHEGPAVGRSRHPGDGADGRRRARAWRARGDRDHASRRLGRELGNAAGADGAVASPDHLQLSGAGAGDGQAGHPQPPPMASRCGAPLEEGGLRHRLRLCDARPVDRPAVPPAPQERPHRRIWRQPRKPRAAAARADRGHQGCGRRHVRRRRPLLRRRADRRGRA